MLCQHSAASKKTGSERHLLPLAAPVKGGKVIGDSSEPDGARSPGVSSPELRCGLTEYLVKVNVAVTLRWL